LELGLSEGNLFLALGQFGLAEPMSGQRLIPIGTVYDCFVPRGLDAFMYGAYQQAAFILVATPSGITLSPEGGAHQSVITPSIGVEIPGVTYFEPSFARELEWILSDAIRKIAAGKGEGFYIRLNTKPIDQTLLPESSTPEQEARLRRQVLEGCYRICAADAPSNTGIIHIFVVGALVPEALEAVAPLAQEGLHANVFVVTSPDLLYRRSRRSTIAEIDGATHLLDPTGLLAPHEIGAPIVTVIDGHSHTLAFLGSALDCPSANLGVDEFGESGSRADLYQKHRVDAESIVAAAIAVADRPSRHRPLLAEDW
jgi:pyruvate dehydrogenase E1 component